MEHGGVRGKVVMSLETDEPSEASSQAPQHLPGRGLPCVRGDRVVCCVSCACCAPCPMLPLQYISKQYEEHGETYSAEITSFRQLREKVTVGSRDAAGRDLLLRYLKQLEYMEPRFPDAMLDFPWVDTFTGASATLSAPKHLFAAAARRATACTACPTQDASKEQWRCTRVHCGAVWADCMLHSCPNPNRDPERRTRVCPVQPGCCRGTSGVVRRWWCGGSGSAEGGGGGGGGMGKGVGGRRPTNVCKKVG